VSKTKPAKLPIGERLRRAFAAATSDLQPRGRLPQGMTTEQAGRAVLAFNGHNMERFATAAEAMHKILAEDYDDDDEPGDQWDEAPPELRPQEPEPGSPSLPGTIPAGTATPEKITELLAEQDRETCRRFAIELLRSFTEPVPVPGDITAKAMVELRRDLEMMEQDAVAMVAKLYDASKRPTLIKPRRDQADGVDDDDGGELDEDNQHQGDEPEESTT
jgi:hypothetical protein